MKFKFAINIFKNWILFAVAITLTFGAVYGATQQNYRQSANDPQIQIAEDITDSLEAGATASSIVSSSYSVDISKTLSPFAIVYDGDGKVTASSAQLDGKTPELPPGIFDNVRKDGEERLTWQPKEDVRIAAVVKKYDKGFVLAGRSLREVEKRERRLEITIGLAWLFTMGATFVSVAALDFLFVKFRKRG